MNFEVNTYSPSDVILAFGGYPLTGWNTISISKSTPLYNTVRGIRGKNTRYRNIDTATIISFSCLQTGEANDILSEILRQDAIFGTGRISLTIKDNSGNSLFHSSEAFIANFPDAVYSGQFEYRVWTINCLNVQEWNVGGNSVAPNSLFNKATTFVGDTLTTVSDAVSGIF